MSSDVEQFVHYQIANAPVLAYPFPHFYVHPVFPDEFFAELRARMPGPKNYVRLDATGTVPKGAYPERFVCSLTDLEEEEFQSGAGSSFWAEFNQWIGSDEFARLVMFKFRDGIAERFGAGNEIRTTTDLRLVRDFTNYSISPHTDAPHKLVSLLFYLPYDESMLDLGTSIYAAKDRSLRCEGVGHHPFEGFKKVATMPYRPNSLFAFFKTDLAFHGVDRIEREHVTRDLLLYNIYVNKVVGTKPEKPARLRAAWPWQRA
jgi:hypothetical protein